MQTLAVDANLATLLVGMGALLAGIGSVLSGIAALRAARREKPKPEQLKAVKDEAA